MKKTGADPKVKKTFVRNPEQRVRGYHKVIHDVEAGSSKSVPTHVVKSTHDLDKPILCSSEVLANYISDTKSLPAPSADNLKIDNIQLGAKVTKKLNFHFNDRIYKNLVELNADVASLKNKKDKKSKINVIKKDLEPNLEDFCQDEKIEDLRPQIPVIRPKLKPVKPMESGNLHRLIASFDVL